MPEFTRQNIGPATEFTISLYLETNNFDVTHFVVAYVRVGDIYEPRWKLRNAEEIANWEKKTVKISELERGKVVIDELQGSSVYALALKVETSDMSSDWSPVIQAETQGMCSVVLLHYPQNLCSLTDGRFRSTVAHEVHAVVLWRVGLLCMHVVLTFII